MSESDFSRGDFFCFSKCSAMASTSANVESSWVFNSRFDPVEDARLSCDVESLASMSGLTGKRLRGPAEAETAAAAAAMA